MSDPRETPFNGRVAHSSLRGRIEAERFADGAWASVIQGRATIAAEPGHIAERELLYGQRFCVLDRVGAPGAGAGDPLWAYGFAERDGYCGYVAAGALYPCRPPTHRVVVRETYAPPKPRFRDVATGPRLYFGSEVTVVGRPGDWSEVSLQLLPGDGPCARYIPSIHLAPIGHRFDDPAAVAELFLGTPYVWGGNSAHGIDCSGLVQAAALACGIACPGDSDQQARAFGGAPLDAPPKRGDLFFWDGHVALATGPAHLIHANAHHMAVAIEPIDTALARIAGTDTGPLTARGRLLPPSR